MYSAIIVEDEPHNLRGLGAMLHRLRPSYSIREASCGNAALSLLAQSPCDILITDIKMPGMDGLTLLNTVLSSPRPPLCAILSGYDDFDYTQRAIQLGVFDYILKPIDDDGLCAMLTRAEAKLSSKPHGGGANWFTADISRYIHANLSNPDLSLTLLASRYHFSSSYLSTWFKPNMGENFHHYLTRLRMEAALDHLKQGKRVYEVASMTGYSDPKYFDKVFKAYYNMTPGAYRRMQRSML